MAVDWEMSEPNWGPLEKAIPADQMADWMWMGTAVANGRRIEMYKHVDTRQYVNIDNQGQAWNGKGDSSYSEKVNLADALRRAMP